MNEADRIASPTPATLVTRAMDCGSSRRRGATPVSGAAEPTDAILDREVEILARENPLMRVIEVPADALETKRLLDSAIDTRLNGHMPRRREGRDRIGDGTDVEAKRREVLVLDALDRERAKREARRRLVMEERGTPIAGRCELCDDVAILSEPDTPALVDDTLFTNSLIGIVGPQGSGKTTVAIGTVYAIASPGATFLGRAVLTHGPVVYVLLEGHALLKRRVAAVKLDRGLPIDEPSGVSWWLDPLDLCDDATVTTFIAATKPRAPVLITIDTWAQAFTGDENSSQDTGIGLRALQRIRRELDCAVMVVHHTNAGATRERGSTALRAGLDTLLMLTTADDALRLVCEKQRDGAPFLEIPIRLVPVPGSSGQVVRLAAEVVPTDELTPVQQRALTRLLQDFVSGASSSEWRATLPEVPERSFYRVLAESSDAVSSSLKAEAATCATGQRWALLPSLPRHCQRSCHDCHRH